MPILISISILLLVCSFYLGMKFKYIVSLHQRLRVTDTGKNVIPGQMSGFIKILLISSHQAILITWYCRFSHIVNVASWVYIYTSYNTFSTENMIRLETILALGITGVIMFIIDVSRWKLIPIDSSKLID